MKCHVIVTEPRPKTTETNDRGKTAVYVIIVVVAAAVGSVSSVSSYNSHT